MNNSEYKGILVFAEQREGVISSVAFELLGKGREIANEINQPLIAVLAGNKLDKKLADELIAQGADKVYVADDKMFEHYITEQYTELVSLVINDIKPEIVFIGASTIGRDLAPRISARIETGLTADCTTLEIDESNGNLLMTRPAFGGNLLATIICPDHRPQMATVRPGVMQKMIADSTRTGEIITFDVSRVKPETQIEVLEVVKEEAQKKNIEEAGVLVSGGRGIGHKDNVVHLENLANELKGMISGSRALVDAGIIDASYQVGQTGKTVRPEVYFACGISGAIQHVAGMEESELIIAINKNPEAAIFEVADIGIVADVNKVLPAIVSEIKKTAV
jgi:electron transfer flavoprotein alpha subunit